MLNSRGEYTERKRRDLEEHRRRVRQLWERAERQLSPEAAAHDRELQVTKDKLRVAYSYLENLERSSDQRWPALKESFERIEAELRAVIASTEARLS